MTKYEPLQNHLRSLRGREWRAAFKEIESIIGGKLPKSARAYSAWWANDATPGRQSHSWLDAGWETSEVNLTGRTLVFRRCK
ncbi:MAG: DUF7662 domain-containing protein [Rhodospirillales bacterium]